MAACALASQQPRSDSPNTQTGRGNQPVANPPINITVTTPKPSPEDAKRDEDRQERNVSAQEQVADFTRVLTILTGAQAAITFFALLASIVAAKAAKKSADTSRDTLITLQRPFVHLRHYGWRFHQETFDEKRHWFSIRPEVENAGPIQTYELMMWSRYELRDTRLPDDFAFPFTSPGTASFIGPRGFVESAWGRITDIDLAAVQRGDKFFYLWGKAEYRDSFTGTPVHTTKYCMQIVDVYGSPMDPSNLFINFRIHPQHNSAD
jgi:hypothetical protein